MKPQPAPRKRPPEEQSLPAYLIDRHATHAAALLKDVEAPMSRPYKLTRDQLKSLYLHQAVADHLVADPDEVLSKARANLKRLLSQHRATMTETWLKRWQDKIDVGVGAVLKALTSEDAEAVELRQNSPFAGVLPEPHRRQILESFKRPPDLGE